MPSGIVKWFNSAKGYGFICPEDGGQDVFAHFSAIVMDGYKCLKAGQPVLYEVNEGPKGLHASNIRADTNTSAESEASKPRTKETATAEA
ncbi:MAG: cold shock domain-containing protein [Gammaproteobacteria bacterium]|jgi:CspA family cold shock protein|nr:cold shock domain-containing protein [Gammaproteobacteria bacterium]